MNTDSRHVEKDAVVESVRIFFAVAYFVRWHEKTADAIWKIFEFELAHSPCYQKRAGSSATYSYSKKSCERTTDSPLCGVNRANHETFLGANNKKQRDKKSIHHLPLVVLGTKASYIVREYGRPSRECDGYCPSH